MGLSGAIFGASVDSSEISAAKNLNKVKNHLAERAKKTFNTARDTALNLTARFRSGGKFGDKKNDKEDENNGSSSNENTGGSKEESRMSIDNKK